MKDRLSLLDYLTIAVFGVQAAFAFYIGDRFYGVATAFVPGGKAAAYEFTSALPVQIVKELEFALLPLISGIEAKPGRCSETAGNDSSAAPSKSGKTSL